MLYLLKINSSDASDSTNRIESKRVTTVFSFMYGGLSLYYVNVLYTH